MKTIKVIIYFLITISFLIIAVYFGLYLFVKSKEIKVNKNDLINSTTINLSEKQIEIACYIINGNRNVEFSNYSLLIKDAFSFNNQIAMITAITYLSNNKSFNINAIKSIERQLIELATKRYIMKNIDYQICYNYYFSHVYFGNGQYGLIDAANFYYRKKYDKLNEKEFICLCLLTIKRAYINPINEEQKRICEEVINKIYKELNE